MKRMAVFLSVFMPAVLFCQEVNKSVKFAETIHDFGKIEEMGGEVSHTFVFRNVGRDTVAMTFARSGCGCVVASVPKEPVLPGKYGKVTVTFDPEFRPGKFSKEIAVISNGRKYNRIWVNGEVMPGKHSVRQNHRHCLGSELYASHRVLNFATVGKGGEKSMTLSLGNNSECTMDVDFDVEGVNAELLKVVFPARLRFGAGGVQKVPVRVKVLRDFAGEKRVKVVPRVKGKRLQPIEIVVKSK